MVEAEFAALHDAYAAEYDRQVAAYDCHVAEVLFGLTYEYVCPGARLLDVGIGSGLSSQPFATAGLRVEGMDFSPAMLDICAAKGFAAGLKRHDLQATPWPYEDGEFDHVVCCGVLHFIGELGSIFGEAARVLRGGGTFAFTTRAPDEAAQGVGYEREMAGPFEIFSHAPAHIEDLLRRHSFRQLKKQRCFVGEDLFAVWVTVKEPADRP